MQAQSDLVLLQYQRAMSYYSPAFAGLRGDVQLTALHNRQWEGMPNSPKSFLVMGDMPIQFFDREHGVGIKIVSETRGLFSNAEIGLQYAYKKKLFGGMLSIGAQAGIINSSFDGTKVELETENDPSIPNVLVNGKAFDAGAGIYFDHKKWYAGISAAHLTAPRLLMNEQYELRLARLYYLTAGYNILPNYSLFSWHPSIFVASDLNTYRLDASMGVAYNEKFFGAINYRLNRAVGLSLGIKLGKFYAGYAYEIPTNDLAKASWGSHELLLSYSFPLFKAKQADVKYKSVRHL